LTAFSQNWQKAILSIHSTIQSAIQNLNDSSLKIVLIVNEKGELQGTLSDGDIRRSLLKGLDINSSIENVIHRNPLVAPKNLDRETVKQIMTANKIYQIPVVDENFCIIDLYLWDEVTTLPVRTNKIVIMAGGEGKRLLPHTESCPKPMVLVAGKPMLEHIIERAKLEGFSNFIIATYYLGHMIEDYFGIGEKFGVNISYIKEKSPLGTAGALGLLTPKPNSPFVVTNGDVITDISYGEMLDFHNRNEAEATMAVRLHEWQHPFGVVQTNGIEISGFEEKPISRSHINAGIYILSPNSLDMLGNSEPCDMPNLFERLQLINKRTLAYPMHEPWLDVGRPEDLKRAEINSKDS
jgi:dTDP-glucose pyrophosphorylase